MMTRRLLWLLSGVLTVAGLAGCGGADPMGSELVADPALAEMSTPVAQVRRKAVEASATAKSRWSELKSLPIVPVSVANLPGGNGLLWSAENRFKFNQNPTGRTYSVTLDPAKGSVSEQLISATGHDMFCPGTAYTASGKLLINGGIDAANTSFYDPVRKQWSAGPLMQIPRGYNASAPLQDGQVLTLGGSWSGDKGNKHAEIWREGAGWRRLSDVSVTPFLQPGVSKWDGDAHMWLISAGNGRVLHAGAGQYGLDRDAR